MNQSKLHRMVGTALLAAIVVVLQMLAGTISFGGVSISLVLVPIVVGAACYGALSGALLGLAFGLVSFIGCVIGTDKGGAVLFQAQPFLCALTCFCKGAAAGAAAGGIYRLVAGKQPSEGRNFAATLLAAVTAPVVNTGLFCAAMYGFFWNTLVKWAGGRPIISYMLVGLVGVNFLVEFGVNIVLSPAVTTILRAIKRK